MASSGTSPHALLATAVLALGPLVVVACAPASTRGDGATVIAQPPLTLPGGAWQTIALPTPADQLSA